MGRNRVNRSDIELAVKAEKRPCVGLDIYYFNRKEPVSYKFSELHHINFKNVRRATLNFGGKGQFIYVGNGEYAPNNARRVSPKQKH